MNQRQSKAQGFLQQEASQQTDPFLAIAGQPSTAANQAQSDISGAFKTPTSQQLLNPVGSLYGQSANNFFTGQQAATDNYFRQQAIDIARQEATNQNPNYRFV